MKRLFKISLLSCLCCHLFLPVTGFGEPQADSGNKTEQANYRISRYVIGSGGVMYASSTNYKHHATAGEACVGGMQGTNHIMLAGFWTSGIFFVDVDQISNTNIPASFKLHQNYPNPFNPETVIEYELPQRCLVTVEVFNTAGQRIRMLNSKIQGPGLLHVSWDGRDDFGRIVGSGVYLYQTTAWALEGKRVEFQQTRKMLLVK